MPPGSSSIPRAPSAPVSSKSRSFPPVGREPIRLTQGTPSGGRLPGPSAPSPTTREKARAKARTRGIRTGALGTGGPPDGVNGVKARGDGEHPRQSRKFACVAVTISISLVMSYSKLLSFIHRCRNISSAKFARPAEAAAVGQSAAATTGCHVSFAQRKLWS